MNIVSFARAKYLHLNALSMPLEWFVRDFAHIVLSKGPPHAVSHGRSTQPDVEVEITPQLQPETSLSAWWSSLQATRAVDIAGGIGHHELVRIVFLCMRFSLDSCASSYLTLGFF